jgi:C4-dicarboxylate transporter
LPQKCHSVLRAKKSVMATVAAVVFKYHEKNAGTFNVKIHIYHKFEKRYIDTTHFASKQQLDSKYNIKDKLILKIFDKTLDEYREARSQLDMKLDLK